MATVDEAEQAVIDLIAETAAGRHNSGSTAEKQQAESVLKLAEAYAWLAAPRGSHAS